MIQALEARARIIRNRHQAMLPNKPRGVPRVNDRRVLNGIFWVLRSGAPWRDLPDAFCPYTACYNRFVRWRRAGVWSRIIDALAAAHDAAVQMIDTSVVRVHQHGACIKRNEWQRMGPPRGGLTSKIHAEADANGLPVRLALSPGEAHDNQLADKLLSRLKSATVTGSSVSSTGSSNVVGWRRYDKLAANYLAFVQLASIRLWLRVNGSTS